MKKITSVLMALVLVLMLGACGINQPADRKDPGIPEIKENEDILFEDYSDAKSIKLSEDKIEVDDSASVVLGGEIVYYHDRDEYESGNPYGEGTEKDKHTEEEAAEHELVTITKPGKYIISGKMKGQLAVDLGENAKDDPKAKVTLIFNGADITCEIAPAVIFYNVYECGKEDTSEAGANVVITDGSVNYINGANVAKIYKDDGEAKKLHKYDGAFYSRMSMIIDGGEEDTGVLNIEAENEGLNSEMHLTINGGNINISAQDDGINANEDGVSVITVNGGGIIVSGGLGAEGDGIDSNGKIVINGGKLWAFGNGRTGDGGIDADMGITVNGGSVAAFGSRNDSVTALGDVACVQLSFASVRSGGSYVEFVDENGIGMSAESGRDFQSVTFAGDNLEKNKVYRLYVNNVLQEYSGNGNIMMPGMGGFGGDFGREERKNAFEVPEGFSEWLENAEDIPDDIRKWLEDIEIMSEEMGKMHEEMLPQMPQENDKTEKPGKGQYSGGFSVVDLEPVYPTEFVITDGAYSFYGINDSAEESKKERVSFTVDGKNDFGNIAEGSLPGIRSIECSENIGDENIQVTLVYTGSSDEITVSEICLLSDGYKAVNGLFDGLAAGEYRLTVAVVSENGDYTGSDSFDFTVTK